MTRSQSLIRILGATLSLALLAFIPLAAQLPAGVVKGASVEGITEYTLDNGLRVLIFPDPSKPTATINLTYMVGSRHEGYGETGMAHLLEHLVFKGTPKHPNIPQELTQHGARANGTTWYDRTNYYETVPATDENIAWALDLEADRMVNSFISRKDLESEFTVVRNEFESGENSPTRVLTERVMSTAFLWHNYGKSTIGNRSDIENVPIERLQAFYRKYYQPDNAILVVAGKIDEPKILKQIADRFGAIPRPVRALERGNMLFATYTSEPVQDGEREVSLRRTGDVQVVMAGYHIPAGAHPDFAPAEVLAEVLSTRPAGRLYKALVEAKKASTSGAFAWQLREPGMLMGQATVRKDQSLADARVALVGAMEGVASTPPTPEEVERAKGTLVKNLELQLNDSESIGLDLTEWAATGDWRLIYIHRDRLNKVTPADVQRIAVTYLKPANRTVGLFYPTESPDRAVIAQVSDAEVTSMTRDYKGNAVLAAGEAFDPSPTNIDARTVRSSLPNGMKLALLSKATRGNVVNARVTLRVGDEKSLTGRSLAARLVPSMLDKGTKTRSRQQIKDEFDRLKAQVFFGGAANNIVATITTTRPNLIPTLRLVAEVLKEPAFDAAEFDKLRTERMAALEQQKSEPGMIANRLIAQKLGPYPATHPLATWTADQELAQYRAVTIEGVRGTYAELVGASSGDVAVVGDFPRDTVATVLRELFGAWKSPKPFTRLARTYFDVPRFTESIETPDKANAIFFAGQNLKLRDDSRDYAALVLGGYMLGGGFLSSRLATRIRQKEGLSYGVGAGIGAQSLDSVGTLTANAIYNPENVVRLEAAFAEEIAKVLRDGFTAEELDKAREGWLQQQLQNRADDGFLVTALSNQANTGRTMAYNVALEKWVAGLTPADVNAIMKKYIDPAKISIVKAGDFKNHPPKPVPAIP